MAALLVLAVMAGVVVAWVLLAPPGSELLSLAMYLLIAGAFTIAAARVVVGITGRSSRLSLRRRVQIAAATGPVVALLNVLAVARLMFVSGGHDLRLLIALILFGGLVGILVALWSTSILTDRVTRIATTLSELARRDGEAPVRFANIDEIRRLDLQVEALALRLAEGARIRESLDDERRNLTAAISHDLRTPLSSIRAMVEALSDGVVHETAIVRRYYASIGRETDRLSRMVDDLMELAQLDAGVLALTIETLSVGDIAAEVAASLQPQASQAGVALNLKIQPGLPPAFIDGGRIERAIANLVSNAIEHTGEGGQIALNVEHRGGLVCISVADTGCGISPFELSDIWTRFYRGDNSRARGASSTSGTGLGLAIARGFVEAHGGKVGVESLPGVGSVFTIALPVNQAAHSSAGPNGSD